MTQYYLKGRRAVRYAGIGKNRVGTLKRTGIAYGKNTVILDRARIISSVDGSQSKVLIEIFPPYVVAYVRKAKKLADGSLGPILYSTMFSGITGEVPLFEGLPVDPLSNLASPRYLDGSSMLGVRENMFSTVWDGVSVPTGYIRKTLSRLDYKTGKAYDIVEANCKVHPSNAHSYHDIVCIGEDNLKTANVVFTISGTYNPASVDGHQFIPYIVWVNEHSKINDFTVIWPPVSLNSGRVGYNKPVDNVACVGRGKIAFVQRYVLHPDDPTADDFKRPDLVLYDVFNNSYGFTTLPDILTGLADEIAPGESTPVQETAVVNFYRYLAVAQIVWTGEGKLVMALSSLNGTTAKTVMYRSVNAGVTWVVIPVTAPNSGSMIFNTGAGMHTLKLGCIAMKSYHPIYTDTSYTAYSSDHGVTWSFTQDPVSQQDWHTPLHRLYLNGIAVVAGKDALGAYEAKYVGYRVNLDNTISREVYDDYSPTAILLDSDIVVRETGYFSLSNDFAAKATLIGTEFKEEDLKPGYPGLLEYTPV